MTLKEAQKLLENFLTKDAVIKAGIEEGEYFLFIAHRDDLLEGRMDPFYSVNKHTKVIRDFSPQNYPDPLSIIERLEAVYVETGI